MVEADGSIRSVDYTADKHSGFNAVVKHSGQFQHPVGHGKSEATSHSEVQVIPKNHKPEEEVSEPESQYQIQYVYPNGEVATDYKPEEDQATQNQEEGKDSSKYEYQGSEEDNQQYQYAPQEETLAESQRSTVHTKFQLVDNHENAQKQQPAMMIKEQYEKIKYIPPLPVDLSLLKPNLGQVLDISVINPVEVDIEQGEYGKVKHKNKDHPDKQKFSVPEASLQPSHELSQEELKKYIDEYYSATSKPIVDPKIETGFKPLRNKPNNVIIQSSSPQTYRTNKKPSTTPGLGSYSSQTKAPIYTKYPSRYPKYQYRGQTVPQTSQYEYGAGNYLDLRHEKKRHEGSRLYRSTPNTGYVRYAKHVNYEK